MRMRNRLATLAVAPLHGHSTCHFRYFMRLMTKHTTLWTEMLPMNAVVRAPHVVRRLAWLDDTVAGRTVAQLGGSCPTTLAKAVRLLPEVVGRVDEVNLNLACPSNAAVSGDMGATLMHQPHVVRDCIHAMRSETDVPVSIKCRIGVLHAQPGWRSRLATHEELYPFLRTVVDATHATVQHVVVHARIAVMGNDFTPRQNRSIPPIRHDVVCETRRLLEAEQHATSLQWTINGEIDSWDDIERHSDDGNTGVMLGRAALGNPWPLWSVADTRYFGADFDPLSCPVQCVQLYATYVQRVWESALKAHMENGQRVGLRAALLAPVRGMFKGIPGGKAFRVSVTQSVSKSPHFEPHDTLLYALDQLEQHRKQHELLLLRAKANVWEGEC